MVIELIILLAVIFLTAASVGGIIVSGIKLRKSKKGEQGNRALWIFLIVLCSLYLALIAAAIVFIILLMVSVTVNGM